jgi:hypothetical protein
MGLLNRIFRASPSRLTRLPTGSFTIDRQGRIITYTLPHSFPMSRMQEIGREVLAYFRGAREAQVAVRELVVHYPALKLAARELRDGAIVFLTPQTLNRN